MGLSMKNVNLSFYTLIILLLALPSLGFVLEVKHLSKAKFDTIPSKFQSKTEHTSYLKNGLKVSLTSLRPVQNQNVPPKTNIDKIDNEKLLTDVMIYPNPITDKLYLTYNVKKNTNVSIKIINVLGSDVLTLMAQRVEAGEQKNTFQISNRLPSGFYFVRMIVGTESVIKRISVL